MKVLLTINGLGKRFSDNGYNKPKFLLDYQDQTILEHIISNINNGIKDDVKVIIGLNKLYIDVLEQIKMILMNIKVEYEFILMDSEPGQAATVSKLIQKSNMIENDESFWVMNCDSIIENSWNDLDSDVAIEVFESDLEYFSYIDSLEKVTIIKEKIVISNLASTGNYYFKSAVEFENAYKNTTYATEAFVSDVINTLIDSKANVVGVKVPNNKVVILGTPKQYEEHI